MKKYLGLFLGLFVCLFVFTGCEKVETGNYKEGTYYGSVVDNFGGKDSVASAVVYVDANGMIKSVFLDTTHTTKSGTTTKKALGDAYNMKPASEVKKEWYEQVELLEAKVVETQGIDFLTLDKDGKTDAVAGVTMKVDALHKALEAALKDAKK